MHLAPEVFNCSAPDTGNMEALVRYGSEAQQKAWLTPLFDGEIRSAFAMTQPDVASSDARNIEIAIVRNGDNYVINGRKWYTTDAIDPRCMIIIFMGKAVPTAETYRQQSMILVPKDTPWADGETFASRLRLLWRARPRFRGSVRDRVPCRPRRSCSRGTGAGWGPGAFIIAWA